MDPLEWTSNFWGHSKGNWELGQTWWNIRNLFSKQLWKWVYENKMVLQIAMLLEVFGSQGTYVDQLVVVTLLQVMQHRGIVKICQVGHILRFLVFRGIDLANLIFLEIFRLLCWSCVVEVIVVLCFREGHCEGESPIWRSIVWFMCVGFGFKFIIFEGSVSFLFLFGREKRRQRVPGLVMVDWRTYVDHSGVVTLLQVMQHWGLVKIGQISHIFGLFVFGRVHLADQVFLEAFLLLIVNGWIQWEIGKWGDSMRNIGVHR